MVRGTALVATVARAVELTGRTTLPNLEAGGELDLTDILLTASDAIYDRLTADGIDPTDLSNAEVFERPVAWHFLALLAAQGFLSEEGQAQETFERLMGLSDRYYEQFSKPLLANVNNRARPQEPIPYVKNIRPDALFG